MSTSRALKDAYSSHCDFCASVSVFRPVGRAKVIDDSGTEAEIARCSECGHWVTAPMPDPGDLLKLYSDSDPRVIGAGWAEEVTDTASRSAEDHDHWIMHYLTLHGVSPGTALEIGPGDGALLRALKTCGWECYAVEPGEWLKDPAVVPNISDLPPHLQVDVFIAHDVLEHMAHPVREATSIAQYLREGCLIFLAFPFSESLDAKLLGSQWPMVRPIGHLNYFSLRSASILVRRMGAHVVDWSVARVLSRGQALVLLMRRPLSAVYGGLRRRSFSEFFRRLTMLKIDFVTLASSGDQLHVVAKVEHRFRNSVHSGQET